MPGKPFQSKLVPHEALIRSLRKAGQTYREISDLLKKEHGVEAHPDTVNSFVIVRARGAKVYTLPEPPTAPPPAAAAREAHGASPSDQTRAVVDEERATSPTPPAKKYVFIPKPERPSIFSDEDLQFNDPLAIDTFGRPSDLPAKSLFKKRQPDAS